MTSRRRPAHALLLPLGLTALALTGCSTPTDTTPSDSAPNPTANATVSSSAAGTSAASGAASSISSGAPSRTAAAGELSVITGTDLARSTGTPGGSAVAVVAFNGLRLGAEAQRGEVAGPLEVTDQGCLGIRAGEEVIPVVLPPDTQWAVPEQFMMLLGGMEFGVGDEVMAIGYLAEAAPIAEQEVGLPEQCQGGQLLAVEQIYY